MLVVYDRGRLHKKRSVIVLTNAAKGPVKSARIACLALNKSSAHRILKNSTLHPSKAHFAHFITRMHDYLNQVFIILIRLDEG